MSDLNKELKWIVPAIAACIFGLGIAVGKTVRAAEVPIEGVVQSRCLINTDVAGVYGNPTADKLSTAAADGGVQPVIRYDITLADAYKAKITTPTDFSTSPTLNDTVTWTEVPKYPKYPTLLCLGMRLPKLNMAQQPNMT